jgi:hypothetical protein
MTWTRAAPGLYEPEVTLNDHTSREQRHRQPGGNSSWCRDLRLARRPDVASFGLDLLNAAFNFQFHLYS